MGRCLDWEPVASGTSPLRPDSKLTASDVSYLALFAKRAWVSNAKLSVMPAM